MTTSLLFVGPASVGPFGDENMWRVGPCAGLVEGGTNGPYFLMNAGHENEFAFMLDGLDNETVTSATIILVALLSQSERARDLLLDTHNLVETPTGLQVAPYWDLADDVAAHLASLLTPVCRIGLVQLDEQPLISPAVVEVLQRMGFSITVFRSNHQLVA
jgi:hypothetical protein